MTDDRTGLADKGQPKAPPARGPPDQGVKFARNNEFQAELRKRVDAYFAHSGLGQRDAPQMYLKTAILLVAFGLFYWLVVFVAQTWWQAIPLAVLLGLATAGIGLNVQHDGGHGAYSSRPWVNKLMAMSLDLIGGSSYLWHYKHVLYHHTYVNITGEDTDVDLGALARVTPFQKRYPFHRLQHLYIWPLYGFMAIKWQLLDDFKEMIVGEMGGHHFPRAKRWDLVTFLVGKLIFFSLAFAIPMLVHPWWIVLIYYTIAAGVLGVVLSVVFQLAHCVEGAEFPMPQAGTTEMEHAWAIHQVETTVDFARRSKMVAWLLGGLNFQVEHHLLPRISHVHFPALSKIVEDTCRQFGIKFNEHATFRAGVASHFRWLREMGRPIVA